MRRMQTLAALGAALAFSACDIGGAKTGYTGYVEAEFVHVASPQPGWVTELAVREGDRVEPGAVLFRLDAEQQELALAEARGHLGEADARALDAARGARPAEIAALEAELRAAQADQVQAKADLERAIPLQASGAISPARLEQAQTRADMADAKVLAAQKSIQVAKLAAREGVREAAQASKSAAAAAYEQAQWNLSQRTVVVRGDAPARVEVISARAGEYVGAGTPVVSILPDGAMKVRFFVPETDLAGLAPGATVDVVADGRDTPVEARVSYVATEAEFTPPVIYSADSRDKLVFAVEARLPETVDLPAGLPVEVRRR